MPSAAVREGQSLLSGENDRYLSPFELRAGTVCPRPRQCACARPRRLRRGIPSLRIGVPLSALISSGFFFCLLPPAATQPSGAVALIYVGAVILAPFRWSRLVWGCCDLLKLVNASREERGLAVAEQQDYFNS